MTFIDKGIEDEYQRYIREHPDIPEYHHPLINMSDTFRAYFTLADYFTDPSSNNVESMLVGVRSPDLLYSALDRQMISYGGKQKYTEPIDICSTLFYGLVKNHSFSDGNKRTALLVLLYQLNLYNYLPNASVRFFERLVVAVAANTLPSEYPTVWKKFKKMDDTEIKTISYILRKNTKKKDHTYHLKMTCRDLANALTECNVNCTVENGKIHFERKISKKWFHGEETKRFAIPFGGWTRSIGATTARDVLTNLDLYDQFSDYQSFLDGNETFYNLIEEFEGPLRRLKDE